MTRACKLITIFILAIFGSGLNGKLLAQQRREIIIQQADLMRTLKRDGLDIRRLIGNVSIKHDETTVKCDSLYDYVGLNKFDAFGNVRVFQDATILYGDTLRFNGATKTGKVRGKVVKLVDEDVTLLTKFIDFNTRENTVNYYGGAIITTPDSKFSSERGKYFSNRKLFTSGGNVAFKDEDIVLNTDSLEYYTQDELIVFHGPTRIYNEENYLYSEKGWHKRNTQESEFEINAFIDNGEQKIFGDKIYYDKERGFSQVTGNGCMLDLKQKTTIYGGSIKYNEVTEDAEVTQEPLAMFISDQSDTLFMRANIFFGKSIKDSLMVDSTLYNLLIGVGNVKFHRGDIQGVCDSITYHSADSILFMNRVPILWNEENQLTANEVKISFRNENIHRMFFTGNSFIVSQEDSTRFNQIKGREMIGYFTAGRLTRLDVNGNGETVYFIRDMGEIAAVNRAESSNLSIGIRDNKVTSIMFREKPIATLFPVEKAELQDVMIKGFAWHNDKRPKSRMDVIPQGLNLNFYQLVEGKANLYRDKKTNPTESLEPVGYR
jgi:lipopolysaccharide export system protein LptA